MIDYTTEGYCVNHGSIPLTKANSNKQHQLFCPLCGFRLRRNPRFKGGRRTQ